MIAIETGVEYHPGHVWRLLRQMGWSLQKPGRRALERNEGCDRALGQRDLKELAVNGQLRAQLLEIGSALGRLTSGPRRRGRRGAELAMVAEAKPKRQRKPITDPEQLERRRQALAKARAVRAVRLKAARGAATGQ